MSLSSIEWTDATWNPIVGCWMISPGCAHCYAEVMAFRLRCMAIADILAGRNPGRKRHYIEAVGEDGKWTGKLVPVPEALPDPMGWKKPRRVFVNSMSDLFHEAVPFDFIDRVFAVMALCPEHTFQVLTKRPERMRDYMKRLGLSDIGPRGHGCPVWSSVLNRAEQAWLQSDPTYMQVMRPFLLDRLARVDLPDGPLPNVWLGTSIENQKTADERIPHLLKVPAAVRFVSCEPLLGPIDLEWVGRNSHYDYTRFNSLTGQAHAIADGTDIAWDSIHPMDIDKINWVIIGGESGPGARPCDIAWIRSLVSQCKATGVAAFVKQLGAKPVDQEGEFGFVPEDGDRRDRKGGKMSEWPKDLRVRGMPEPVEAA